MNKIDVGKAEKLIKRVYTLYQKRRIAAYARKNSVTGPTEHFHVPRTSINRWIKDGYFERKTTNKGTKN